MPDLILDFHTLFGPIPPRGAAQPGTERLRSLLTRHEIAGAVTVSTRALFHSAPAGNRETLALCQDSGGILQPAAVLDPRLPNAAQTVAGARVLCLLPASQHWPVLYAPLADCLKAVAAAGGVVPLYIEVSRPGDATAAAQMVRASGYAGAVVLGAFGGDTLTEAVSVARGNDKFRLATDGLRGVGEVDFAVKELGAGRVVFASGVPVRSLGAALALVRQANLSPADAAQVMGGNARGLLATGGGVA